MVTLTVDKGLESLCSNPYVWSSLFGLVIMQYPFSNIETTSILHNLYDLKILGIVKINVSMCLKHLENG